MRVTLDRPWLECDLGADHRVLSWAVHRPGIVTARRILWREVRNADLPPDLDVNAWLAGELNARGADDAVTMLTSRDVTAHHIAWAEVEGVRATAVVTLGLTNGERVGFRQPPDSHHWGTINIAVQLSVGLTFPAMVEAMGIITQARTAAVIAAGQMLPQGAATGTGTDCIALAVPEGEIAYAGMHTAVGEVLGRATFDAVAEAAAVWQMWFAQALAARG